MACKEGVLPVARQPAHPVLTRLLIAVESLRELY